MKEDGGGECYVIKGPIALIASGVGMGEIELFFKKLVLNLEMWRFLVTLARDISLKQTGQMELAMEIAMELAME